MVQAVTSKKIVALGKKTSLVPRLSLFLPLDFARSNIMRKKVFAHNVCAGEVRGLDFARSNIMREKVFAHNVCTGEVWGMWEGERGNETRRKLSLCFTVHAFGY